MSIKRILYCLFSLTILCPNQLFADSSVKVLESKLKSQNDRIMHLEQALEARQMPTNKKSDYSSSGNDRVAVGYKKGFFIKHKNNEDKFKLKINGRMQFRYTGFSRKDSTYTFSDGTTGQQANLSDFEIERGRLEFKGHMFDPAFQFYLNLDFDTDDNHDVKAHDFWFNYVFNDAFTLYAGKAFVPGSREWIDGSTTTHLVDRSMATSYFRPDRSLGIWAIGEALPGVNYRAMVANGFKTTDLEREDEDTQFTYAATVWGDVLGDYGSGRADLSHHEELAVRLGGSFTYSPIDDSELGDPIGEADAVRLSNGVKLSAPGALAAGVTVDQYDIFLYAVDLSMKYRGWSMNSEAYYRSIESIKGQGGEILGSYADKGAYVDIGYFLIPQHLEAVARVSHIDGDIADSTEYAGGLNYYINGTHKNKLTLDVTRLDDSPVSSSGPNYFVGATGVLYRLAWQVAF